MQYTHVETNLRLCVVSFPDVTAVVKNLAGYVRTYVRTHKTYVQYG